MLFNPFSQVDASTTRKYGGTGFGLSIVKQLCELMGGRIDVSSGRAQTVLPTVNIHSVPILIVDDNLTTLNVLRNQLEHRGAKITEANSGAEAIKELKHNYDEYSKSEPVSASFKYQLAFVDMQMPGIMFAKTIRNDRRFDNLHLILMTSMSAVGDANYYSQLGFSGYFSKPTTTHNIFRALAVLLARNKVADESDSIISRSYLEELDGKSNSIQGTNILLVNDNYINQEVGVGVLEEFGVFADVAGNGIEAINALKQRQAIEPYQVILMHCQMPKIDGYEAIKRIRAGDAGPIFINVPIIAVTANTLMGDREKCLAAGMNDYIAKPIDADELENSIRCSLNGDGDGDSNIRPEINRSLVNIDSNKPWVTLYGRVSKLVKMAITGMSLNLDNLKVALENKDFRLANMEIHPIKESSGNLGGLSVHHMSKLMEQAGNNHDEMLLISLFPHCFPTISALCGVCLIIFGSMDGFARRRYLVRG
jgi:CheY-like chemotaxis protein